MPFTYVDKFIEVTEVTQDTINIQIGPAGYPVSKVEIQTLMDAEEDAIETLKRNMAIRLRLSGVKLSEPLAIKQCLEAATFKLPG